MNYTPNYGLRKPGDDDFYDIADFNANADIMDAKLRETADATGAALVCLPSAEFESGALRAADGTKAGNNKRIRMTGLIPDAADYIQATEDMECWIACYDAEGRYLGAWQPDTRIVSPSAASWSKHVDLMEIRSAAGGYLRFCIVGRRSTDAEIAGDDVANAGAKFKIYAARLASKAEPIGQKAVDALVYSGAMVRLPDGAAWSVGYFINKSGVPHSADPTDPSYDQNARYYGTTDFYAPQFRRLYYDGAMMDPDNIPYVVFCHEYDATRRWLRRTLMCPGCALDLGTDTQVIRFVFGRATKYATDFSCEDIPAFGAYGLIRLETPRRITAGSCTWTLHRTVDAAGQEVAANTYAVTDPVPTTERGFAWDGDDCIGKMVNGEERSYEAVAYLHEYDADGQWIQRSLLTASPARLTNRTANIRFAFGRKADSKPEAGKLTADELVAFGVRPLTDSEAQTDTAARAMGTSWGKANLQANAQQLYSIQFTPIRPMPTQHSRRFFAAGELLTGIPYSSARAYNKMVGVDVSLRTFMSAVVNPRSVLYTRRLRTRNAGTYYGVVCSAFASHAMGFDVNLTTAFLRSWDVLERHPYTAIEIGDFLIRDGHIILVVDLARDTYGRITAVTYAESVVPNVHIVKDQAWETFLRARETGGYLVYRYPHQDDVQYTASPYVQCFDEAAPEEPITYPDIMPEYGDHAVLLAGESTGINVLRSGGYTGIVVLHNNAVVLESAEVTDFSLQNLQAGTYEIIITDSPAAPDAAGAKTSRSFLHVVGCRCSFDAERRVVSFADYGDATPVSVIYSCGYYYGNPMQYDIINKTKILNEDDVESGSVSVGDLDPRPDYTPKSPVDYWASVVFQTPWGSATWRDKPFNGVWDDTRSRYDPMPMQYEVIT